VFPIEVLLVLLTLLGEPNDPVYLEYNPIHNELVLSIAVELELLNDEGRTLYFIYRENFQNDIDLLRERYQRVKDCPPIHESNNFWMIDHATAADGYLVNTDHRKFWEARQDFYSMSRNEYWRIKQVLAEFEQCAEIYYYLRDLKNPQSDIVTKKISLKNLKDKLGFKKY